MVILGPFLGDLGAISGHLQAFWALSGKLTILYSRYIQPKHPILGTLGVIQPKQLRLGPLTAQNVPTLPKMDHIRLTVVPSALAGM